MTSVDNHVPVSTRPTPQTVITSRTVVDSNGNPLHVGNPVHVTGSFTTSVNSMSHLHHITRSASTNNATHSSQNAQQHRAPQTVISTRTVVDNNGNPCSNHMANTVHVTGLNNTSMTSIPHSVRSRRTAYDNNATHSNMYRIARHRRKTLNPIIRF